MPAHKSLSPIGLTMPIAEARLNMGGKDDPEGIVMKFWSEENTPHDGTNRGLVPLDHILHECTSECREHTDPLSTRKEYHVFTRPLNKHDVKVAAATVQWLATNNGRSFLIKFLEQIGYVVAPYSHDTNLPAFLRRQAE